MSGPKLLQFLSAWVDQFELPKKHFKVWPFYQTVSRLDYKPDVFDYALTCRPMKEIMAIPNHGKTFEQVCLERAESLKLLDGPIYVMWSGGIDSTAVMTAIFRTFSQADLDRVTVLCDKRSIKENPNYFKLIVKNKVKTTPSTMILEPLLEKGWVVTGELGDAIFGHDGIMGTCIRISGESVIHDKWENHIPKLFEFWSPGGDRYVREVLSPILDEAPFKITSVYEFGWWYHLSQKWQNSQLRFFTSNTWKNPKHSYSKIIHFYDYIDFELWSIYGQELKIDKTLKSYKQVSKQFSVDWSGDTEYMNKLKEPSLIHLFTGHEINWGLDENWNFLTKEQALEKLL
jgi:hypothetical protein